ncbi:MAG: hypothetical protein KA387_06350 [Rubrivivax sp.]|nr:hypothetical protein [Rubrivivax sp.]
MTQTAKIRVLRPCLVGGERQPVDAVLTLPILDALAATDSGRCAFVHEADRAAAQVARRQETAQMLRTHGRQRPDPGSPWQPVDYLQ